MAVLTWDADGERLFETGVDHAVLYLMDSSGNYGDGIAWNGITGITESPEGADANDIYADNIKYLSLISKEDWKGTIKAYTFPKEFNECMGNYGIGTAGSTMGVKGFIGQQTRRKFALSWRSLLGNDVLGDKFAYKIHIAWGLSAAPSEMDHATQNDSPEAQEFSWEISSIPPQASQKIYVGGDTETANEKSIQPCAHVFVASKIVIPGEAQPYDNSTFIGKLENVLYGTVSTTATVPKLDQLIKFCKNGGTWPVT